MEGIIEFHGAKQMFVSGDFTTNINNTINDFISGDKVLYNDKDNVILLKRQEQAVIGIIKNIYNGFAYLHITNFSSVCKYSPKIKNDNYKIGDRLVIWLHSNGTISVKNKYNLDNIDDVKCLLDMYCLMPLKIKNDVVEDENNYNNFKIGKNLYTIDEIINHNDLDTFTIDPTNSVDFDDAITVDVNEKTIYVHIVDIAASELLGDGNKKLRERCFTLYLANEHTEHLLDEVDASKNLSLIEGKERKVITVKIVLDEEGMVSSYDIYRSTIVVKKRWNYEQVLKAINEKNCGEAIQFLADLTIKRSKDVTYNISLPSLRIKSDLVSGKPETIICEETNDISHTLVATAMILANLVVSKYLSEKNVLLPNRFHDSLKGFIMPDFDSTGNELVDSFIVVKRFARACYSVDKKGHFGLGIKDYVHFTSPMRRYADVLVHRLLAGYQIDDLEEQVDWINLRSKLVKSAQDMYISWKVLRWIEEMDKEKIYEIWVTGINASGIIWFMPSLSLNGFLHVSNFEPKQYWKFINDKLIGTSLNGGIEIGMGTKLNSKIREINKITGEVFLNVLI
jgi:ribonuclease R